jgi:hypothetical protein
VKYNLKKLYNVEDKEQYLIEISNRFTDSENLGDAADIETIRENIKISAKRIQLITN